mmetsp:Transcript_1608/g.2309  ORF Transcript_1608/g.2309 Transcript_1608/m.2309 type:complete len:288 (+) Transcript_1608:121-984(+)
MKLTFQFSSAEEEFGKVNHIIENHEDAVAIGNTIMAGRNSNSSSSTNNKFFNGLEFYNMLRNLEGCTQVDISNIAVRYNSFCHGFQVTYRSTFRDGSIREYLGPACFFSSGYYSYHSGPWRQSQLDLSLDDNGEYICGIRINQGEILDGITFVTSNGREVHFGGHGGTYRPDSMMLSSEASPMKIIALTGVVNGVIGRVGFYAISRNWEVIGHYLLLKKLLDDGRASINMNICTSNNVEKNTTTTIATTSTEVDEKEKRKSSTILTMLMSIEKEDVFRYVLTFLIHK